MIRARVISIGRRNARRASARLAIVALVLQLFLIPPQSFMGLTAWGALEALAKAQGLAGPIFCTPPSEDGSGHSGHTPPIHEQCPICQSGASASLAPQTVSLEPPAPPILLCSTRPSACEFAQPARAQARPQPRAPPLPA